MESTEPRHSFPGLSGRLKAKLVELPVEKQVIHSMKGGLPNFIPQAVTEDLCLGQWLDGRVAIVRKENVEWRSDQSYTSVPKQKKPKKIPKSLLRLFELLQVSNPEQLQELLKSNTP